MRILIPAYEPDDKLITLIHHIKEHCSMNVIIIDDGSGPTFSPIFQEAENLGCAVLHHPKNLGKGAALKTGFNYLIQIGESEGVVCADCDGQHTTADICKIASEIQNVTNTVVLGLRQFSGKVPVRSRFGNFVTRIVFNLCSGYKIHDTQTGLRGYPASLFSWLCGIEGTRFEYEMNVLLELKPSGYSVRKITIQTIYDSGNSSSHFRPFIDSIRVYLPFVKFSASSLMSATLDFGLLFYFANQQSLLFAVIFSRVISSLFNFSFNHYFVFRSKQPKKLQAAPKYFLLVSVIMLFNYLILNELLLIGISLAPAKIITEISLFLFSYFVQKKIVFSNSPDHFKSRLLFKHRKIFGQFSK